MAVYLTRKPEIDLFTLYFWNGTRPLIRYWMLIIAFLLIPGIADLCPMNHIVDIIRFSYADAS